MNTGGIRYAKAFQCFIDYPRAFFHRKIEKGFVLQSNDGMTFIIIANPAFEGAIPAACWVGELPAQFTWINRCIREGKWFHPPATGGMKTTLSPSLKGACQSRNSALIATLSCSA